MTDRRDNIVPPLREIPLVSRANGRLIEGFFNEILDSNANLGIIGPGFVARVEGMIGVLDDRREECYTLC